jgi:pectinesterase
VSKVSAVGRLSLLLSLVATAACATSRSEPEPRYHVRTDCRGIPACFESIQAALDAAAQTDSADWVRIDVGPGDYYEKITVQRGRTRLSGHGPNRTRIHFDAVAQTAGRYHRANWGTPGSATLSINADQVIVEGIAVENTYDYLSNDALPEGDARKIANSQAVALLLDVASDRVYVDRAKLVGYQDTLFANGKRALIRRSLIAGNVDFIFGNGQLLVEDSEIRSRTRAARMVSNEIHSFIAAPSTPLTQRFGIVINRSHLTRERGVPDGVVALGRPWHPTTNFADGRYADPDAVGYALYIDCRMDAHIHPERWTTMNGTARDGSKTAVFRPQDSRFAEVGSRGAAVHKADIGMSWTERLSIDEIKALFFGGWSERDRDSLR